MSPPRWTALVATEWLKLRTVRLPVLLSAATVALTLALALQPVLGAGRRGSPSVGTAGALLAVFDATGRGPLLALVLGVLVVTAEHRHGTITPVLLQTPARVRLLVAKAGIAVLGGFGLGLLAMATSATVGVLSGAVRAELFNSDITWRMVGLILAYPAYGLLGVGIGALLARIQPAAVLVPLAWLLFGEGLAIGTVARDLVPWTIGGATAALANAGDLADVLPIWGGGAVLLGYVLLAIVTGAVRVTRTDVA